jgi:hypothetical protein
MKSGFTAATALLVAIAATSASAGVVISQEIVNQTGARKTNQTVMVQGHKQKVITGDDEEVITDLDAGTIYLIQPKIKRAFPGKFPPTGAFAMRMVLGGSSVELKKTGATHEVAGYACNDYTGSAAFAHHVLSVTKCVAGGAPGAKEFVEFQKALADKLKLTRLVAKSEVPDGIPVSSSFTTTQAPWTPPRAFPPGTAKKLQQAMAKYKPITNQTTVSKIEVKDIPAEAFAVPAGYTKGQSPDVIPRLQVRPGPGMPPLTKGIAPGSPPAPAAPAAPAASPAPH